MWSTAAVARLLQGSVCCAFKDTEWLFELLLPFYQLFEVP